MLICPPAEQMDVYVFGVDVMHTWRLLDEAIVGKGQLSVEDKDMIGCETKQRVDLQVMLCREWSAFSLKGPVRNPRVKNWVAPAAKDLE